MTVYFAILATVVSAIALNMFARLVDNHRIAGENARQAAGQQAQILSLLIVAIKESRKT